MNKLWKEYLYSLLLAVFLALVIRTFIITGYKVPTISMNPTLVAGDFIFVYKLNYGFKIPLLENKVVVSKPEIGDVVAFTFPDQPRVQYVKRVVGLEGDRIEIKNGTLFRNDQKIIFPFQSEGLTENLNISNNDKKLVDPQEQFGPIVVPSGNAFLMGDNRLVSDDSRYWGSVPIEKIEGKVVIIWFSWSAESGVRWQRVMKIIH